MLTAVWGYSWGRNIYQLFAYIVKFPFIIKLCFLSVKYFLKLMHWSPVGILALGVHVSMTLHNYSKFIFFVHYIDLPDFTSFVIRMCFLVPASWTALCVSLLYYIMSFRDHHIGVIIPSGQFVMAAFLFLCLVWLCYVVSFKGHIWSLVSHLHYGAMARFLVENLEFVYMYNSSLHLCVFIPSHWIHLLFG